MKKFLLFAALVCCMMPVMAQRSNDNKILKEMRERKKKVELLNSRANTYTEKLDSLIAANIYREIISYDERFNCKKVNIYNYDSIGGWVLEKVYDYEFDSQDRFISTTCTNLSNEQNSYRYTNEYDDQGRLVEEIYWSPIEGTWVSYFKMTFEYNAQGNLSKATYSYIDENNEWVVEYYYEYNYENADETQCLGYYWDESTQNYELDELEVFHYENQLCTLEEYFLWDSEGSVWLPYFRAKYSYFDNGNLKEETVFESFDWGVLEPYARTQFEYDSHNNNILTRYYMYSEDWVQTRQDECEYDLNVPITNVAGLSFRYGGYYNDKKLKEKEINSDGEVDEYVFYYSNTGSSVTEKTESLLSVWPNPVSETLNLKGDMTQVQIYSVDGRLVMSLDQAFETINVKALPTGNYLLKAILNDGSVTTQKFLKK